jgi:ankyrin repeat protein
MSTLDDFANAIERNDSNFIESAHSNREVDANARLPRDHDPPALVYAAWCGDDATVALLLNAGELIDDVDLRGRSACHAAAQRGRTSTSDVMRVLLAHRPKPNLALTNLSGETALQIAIRFQSWRSEDDDVALLLVRAGASAACAVGLRPARLLFRH